MKNLLTKTLFISLLSSAVMPSGIQASFATAGAKKFAELYHHSVRVVGHMIGERDMMGAGPAVGAGDMIGIGLAVGAGATAGAKVGKRVVVILAGEKAATGIGGVIGTGIGAGVGVQE